MLTNIQLWVASPSDNPLLYQQLDGLYSTDGQTNVSVTTTSGQCALLMWSADVPGTFFITDSTQCSTANAYFCEDCKNNYFELYSSES